MQLPPGNWVAPAGSYRSGGGGDEAVEAFETTGRFGGSASRQAATRVNAVQAPKKAMWKPTRLLYGEGRRLWRQEGTTPHDATRSRGSTGVWAVACLHTEIRRNTGSLDGGDA